MEARLNAAQFPMAAPLGSSVCGFSAECTTKAHTSPFTHGSLCVADPNMPVSFHESNMFHGTFHKKNVSERLTRAL